MQPTKPPSSLIMVCDAATLKQQRLAETITYFSSVFALELSGSAHLPPGVRAVPDEILERGLLRRFAFFAGAEHVPYMVAPLLLNYFWNQQETGDSVIAYPGVSAERLLAARQMLEVGCEAVLLRRDDKPSIVIALARNTRNERLVAHWADRMERFSSDPNETEEFDPSIGRSMVDYLCDRVGSIRDTEHRSISYGSSGFPIGEKLTPILRRAVRVLLPELQQLRDDPFANALPALNAPSAKVRQDSGNLITSLMFFIWFTRPDLQAALDLSMFNGRRGLVDWFLERGAIEYDMTEEFLAPVRSQRQTGPAAPPAQPAASLAQGEPLPDPRTGVNLVGYPRAEMGMGELLRQSAAAFSTTFFPFCIVDFNFGIIASQQETRYESLLRSDNPFRTNLFHITADQMRLAWERLGPQFFDNHYNIGYWTWELSNFPDQWHGAIDLVDEIWAPSRFIQDAISKKTNKPVVWMPLSVEFPTPAVWIEEGGNREKFGLPSGKFLFLFSFDFSSFAARKNASACIQAFQKAFPETCEEAGLVIKTIRHARHKREFWDLLRAVGDDRRIFLVDRLLRQEEMRELIASCDSFVSLHRSEGFGFGMAEAMYLGKPVIATNYSGNVDFTKSDNSCLVNYRLVPVKAGEYLFPEGQVWAEPSIEDAAKYMRLLVDDRDYARRLGSAAADFIRREHSTKAVGARYAKRLEQINSSLDLPRWFRKMFPARAMKGS